MYKQKDYIKLNQWDKNQIIWRYMNFEKFISLLQNKALFFSTCFNMQKLDPFEGEYTKKNLDMLEITKKLYELPENMRKKPKEYRELFLKNTFINCWHANNNENAAMWKIYASNKNGIAIKSTIKDLNKGIKNKKEYGVIISDIQYLDYNAVANNFDYTNYIKDIRDLAEQENCNGINKINIYNKLEKYYNSLIRTKKQEYTYENEIRVVSPFVNDNNKDCIKDYGKFIKVDLETLISEIIISPCAEELYVDLVKDVSRKYNLKCKISKSKLYEKYHN